MKNLLIIIGLIFLTCKDKVVSNDTNKVEVAAANALEAVAKTEAVDAITEISNESSLEDKVVNSPYIKSALYKGALNSNIKISMYVIEQENSCGGDLTYFTAMYKYDNQEKWILLDVSTDRQKKNYCMVEDGFSGVLFLEENEGSFKGHWISPDTKKQFKVELENQLLDIKLAKDHTVIQQLDDILFDDLLYNKNDC